jgi:hypothetical protein
MPANHQIRSGTLRAGVEATELQSAGVSPSDALSSTKKLTEPRT